MFCCSRSCLSWENSVPETKDGLVWEFILEMIGRRCGRNYENPGWLLFRISRRGDSSAFLVRRKTGWNQRGRWSLARSGTPLLQSCGQWPFNIHPSPWFGNLWVGVYFLPKRGGSEKNGKMTRNNIFKFRTRYFLSISISAWNPLTFSQNLGKMKAGKTELWEKYSSLLRNSRCKDTGIRGIDKYQEILTFPKAKTIGSEVI